jgi:hypothetical protein
VGDLELATLAEGKQFFTDLEELYSSLVQEVARDLETSLACLGFQGDAKVG